jgi:hypothetical protein
MFKVVRKILGRVRRRERGNEAQKEFVVDELRRGARVAEKPLAS